MEKKGKWVVDWKPKRGEEVEFFTEQSKWYTGIFVCSCDKYFIFINKYSIEYFDKLSDYDRIKAMNFATSYRKIKTKEEKHIEKLEERLNDTLELLGELTHHFADNNNTSCEIELLSNAHSLIKKYKL